MANRKLRGCKIISFFIGFAVASGQENHCNSKQKKMEQQHKKVENGHRQEQNSGY